MDVLSRLVYKSVQGRILELFEVAKEKVVEDTIFFYCNETYFLILNNIL